MRIGALEVLPVFDGQGREQAREVLAKPGAADDPWACHADQLDGDGNLEFTLGGFLLRTAGRTVLVDAGAGTIGNSKYRGGALLDSLRSLGVAPADVTDVVFTHLHFDHVGWATRKGEIVFPNATYRVHQADWDHFVDAPDAQPGAVRKLSPLAGRLAPFTADTTLAPGLDSRHTPGHTPGSTVFVISSEGERALLIGDVAHSVVELTEPEWEAVFDVDPAAARAARAALAADLTGSGDLIAPAHLPGLRFGRLIAVDGRRRWMYA
jgi:glyoxylase-like metal-dependent hydrolase (beta-lactamase superfamily II)